MRVLLDQATPLPIRKFLSGHDVQTAFERGWDTLQNGELLKAAEDAAFEVFITPDKNIRYQQNLGLRRIAIIVLGSPQWPVLRSHAERVAAAVNGATPGSYTEVQIPA
jgi:hypothetical protein